MRKDERPGKFFAWTATVSAIVLSAVAAQQAGEHAPDPRREFVNLMTRVSDGWTKHDTELALGAFTDDALYTEPPDLQMYRGAKELRVFFDRITPGATMKWHHLWYDPVTGFGAGEYSFKNGGRTTAVHGVAVVEIRDGRIARWREYQRRGAIDFGEFHDPQDKAWQSTIDDL